MLEVARNVTANGFAVFVAGPEIPDYIDA